MERRKLKDFKFLRNIIIGVFSLLIAAIIINIAPGYKRDKYKDVINLVVNEENKTEFLQNKIYVNENETIYISEADIRNLLDKNIYYDEKNNQIITTSNTKVANIVLNQNTMIVNNSTVSLLDTAIRINNNIYLPISEMDIVYNIKTTYIEKTNIVVIDMLDKGMIKAKVEEESDIKFKPRGLSKNIGTLEKGETVSCFYTTSKGWRHIRTSDGVIGYVKANKLGDEYIVRQDMQTNEEAIKITLDEYKKGKFEIEKETDKKQIYIKSTFNIKDENIEVDSNIDEEEEYKVWAIISNTLFQTQTDSILQSYKTRTDLIDLIVKEVTENNLNGISIDFNGIKDNESMKRFIIELAPKLREIGITTCIVLNENIEKQNYIDIVDYIVE